MKTGTEATIPIEKGAHRRAFPTAAVAAILVLLVALLGVLLLALTGSDDRLAARERAALLAFLQERAGVMSRTSALLLAQTEMPQRVASADRSWIQEKLGTPLDRLFGYERTFLVDRTGHVIYASVNGSEASPSAFETVRPMFQRLLARETPNATGEPVSGFFAHGRLVGLATLRPFASVDTQPAAPHLVCITIDLLDESFLRDMAKHLQIKAIRIADNAARALGENSVDLENLSGAEPISLVWSADRPGVTALQRVAPVIAALSTVLLAVCLTLLFSARRTTRALTESEARATALAFHDSLTGLANRASFMVQLDDRMQALGRGEVLALLFIDLDGFKDINDTLGHGVGDELLCHVARRLEGCIGADGVAARFGGDEFVLLVVSDDSAAVSDLARRLLAAIQEPLLLEGHELNVGASVGTAVAPRDATDGRELMRRADIALYRAKAEGRGVCRAFEAHMEVEVLDRRRVELELAEAIGANQLILLFQPLVDVDNERIVGFEALVRWDHPVRGRLLPITFVPVAERSRIIHHLDGWVLRNACESGQSLEDVTISVNMSAINLRYPDFIDQIFTILDETGFDPNRLELEITESALFQLESGTEAVLRRLRDAGVRIALDDFGTGHASLVHVRRLPITKIKIDKSFIANLGLERDAAAIVEYVVRLGRSLGIILTAEGVETREQLRFLRAFGAQQAQGFLFSAPVSLADAAALLEQQTAKGLIAPPGRRPPPPIGFDAG